MFRHTSWRKKPSQAETPPFNCSTFPLLPFHLSNCGSQLALLEAVMTTDRLRCKYNKRSKWTTAHDTLHLVINYSTPNQAKRNAGEKQNQISIYHWNHNMDLGIMSNLTYQYTNPLFSVFSLNMFTFSLCTVVSEMTRLIIFKLLTTILYPGIAFYFFLHIFTPVSKPFLQMQSFL